MQSSRTLPRPHLRWLIAGDILAILVITLIGFLTHYQGLRGWRWLSSFVPLLVSWFAVAPCMGVYDAAISQRASRLWRPALAALASAPLAAVLRGLWLNSVIPPVFALVLALTSALGFVVWRGLWVAGWNRLVGKRTRERPGPDHG